MPRQTHVPNYTKHFPSHRHLLTHTPFNTYTHLHTHLATCILRTNSIRRPPGRAAGINFTSTVTLNPFQRTHYKVLLRNVALSYGQPALPFVLVTQFFRFLQLYNTPFSTHFRCPLFSPSQCGHFRLLLDSHLSGFTKQHFRLMLAAQIFTFTMQKFRRVLDRLIPTASRLHA